MKHIKAELLSGDFLDNTMTFEIDGPFTLQSGNYVILKEKDYKQMHEALSKVVAELRVIGTISEELAVDLFKLQEEIES